MFSVIEKSGKIDVLWDDVPVLRGLCPAVQLEDGSLPEMPLLTAESDGHSACFTWGDESLSTGLALSWKEQKLLIRMRGDICYESAYPAVGFAEKNGIGLHMDALESKEALLSFFHFNRWWTRNHTCSSLEEIKSYTSACVGLCSGMYYHLQTVADAGMSSYLEPASAGATMWMTAGVSGVTHCDAAICSVVMDSDFSKLSEKTAQWLHKEIHAPCRPASEKAVPELFHYLGWCSWNAFYEKVDAEGVLAKADEFVQRGLPLRWVLLDHGWSTEKDGVLYSFEENHTKFPDGLAGLKQLLKDRGVDWMGVWQGFCGHWGTIAPDSEVAKEMAPHLMHTPGNKLIPKPELPDVFQFWDTWHRALKKKGVDFVKVDIQSSLPIFVRGAAKGETAAKAAHRGLEASVGVNFDGNLLNCMGMGMEAVLSRPMSALSRSSDDFFPHKENSFVQHALDNAYNAVWHSGFYHGDWDMWWTNHPEAVNNQYLRAVSGGPIYVSDRVGETKAELLRPLIFSDGHILQCDRSGMVARDQLFCDVRKENGALKIQNHIGNTGYVACFAICDAQDESERGVDVSPADVPELETLDAEQFIAVRISDDKIWPVEQREETTVMVRGRVPELLQFTPRDHHVTLLGDLDKCLPSAVIRQCTRYEDRVIVDLVEGGRIAYWSEQPHEVWVDGVYQSTIDQAGPQVLALSLKQRQIEFRFSYAEST